MFFFYFLWPAMQQYIFFIGFSLISAFFTAVLLTPIAVAASVKLVYSITSKGYPFNSIIGLGC